MNIGLLTTYLAVDSSSDSGIAQHFRVLADTLAEAGHRVHVVHPAMKAAATRAKLAVLRPAWTCDIIDAQPPRLLARILRRSWPAQVFLGQLWAVLGADRVLARASREHHLEIVETHATDAPAVLFLNRHVRPLVLTRVSTTMSQMAAVSTIHSRIRGWQSRLEQRAVRQSDALVTHTAQHRDALCAIDGYPASRFELVPHGLPEPPPAAPRPASDEIGVLFVGRFEDRKGIDVLLAALPAVAAACPRARFTLAGDQGGGRLWSRFCESHPALAARIHAPGRVSREQLDALYDACDLFVAPSRYESFGLIYLEAMSRGKPVIGCQAGGIPEVVTDQVTGLLARPGDVASLAAVLIRLIQDAPLRQRLGAAGRQDFSARFSARSMGEQSVHLYRRLLATRERERP